MHEGAAAAKKGASGFYQNEISEDNKYSVIGFNRVIMRCSNDEVASLARIHENRVSLIKPEEYLSFLYQIILTHSEKILLQS